jgi:hypothetical protein
MLKILRPLTLTVFAAASSAATLAAAAAGDAEFARPESDRSNYLSDRLNYSFDNRVLLLDTTAAQPATKEGCAPAETSLKAIGKIELKTEEKKDGKTEIRSVPMLMMQVTRTANAPSADTSPDGGLRQPSSPRGAFRCAGDQRVAVGDVVLMDPTQLDSVPPHRFGLTYGALMVPYKYYIGGDHEFSGAATVGGYLGYREASTGYDLRLVGFLGASSISVPQQADGQEGTKNLAGISYGLGVLGTVKDSFQLGLVLGWDRVGRSANFANNGKPWVAVSLGYAFSN